MVKIPAVKNVPARHQPLGHINLPFIGKPNEAGLEILAKYIVRACFSQQRMIYIRVEKSSDITAKVIYTSKDGRSQETFDALDWLALFVTHIPGRYEQTPTLHNKDAENLTKRYGH